MGWFDAFRLFMVVTFGVGVGFMTMTNWIAFKVLRPPKKLGFLWWHVTAISIAFLCFGTVAVERVVSQLGSAQSWFGWLTVVGVTLFSISQFLIFRVERQRLVEKQAVRQVAE